MIKMFNKMISEPLRSGFLWTFSLLILGAGCKKSGLLGPDPYQNTVEPLVKFLDTDPDPLSGIAGSKATFYVRGLKDRDTSSFQFFINQERAQVVSIKDSAVTILVPMTASSGAASVLIDGQNYFGPIFDVDGKVRIDPTFDAGSGVNAFGSINDLIAVQDGYLLVGNFVDFSGNATLATPVNGIVQISKKGVFQALAGAGKAIEGGSISSIFQIKDSFYIGGAFSGYNIRGGIHNVTKIWANGALDTSLVDLVNLDPENRPQDSFDTVPTFNGGVAGSISKMFYDGSGIVAIGAFNEYDRYYYFRSTTGNLVTDSYNIGQFVRMNLDGSLDSSYNRNPGTNIGFPGTNGYITDALQLGNGSILVGGLFTKFNGASVGNIFQLTKDGGLDPAFNSGGVGANGGITKMQYSVSTHKIMITGDFTKYNNQPVNGVAMLNEDGTLDAGFHFGTTKGGVATFAAQLSNGLILVTGYFDYYEGIFRKGMLFLNPDGSMAAGYNNTGSFNGRVERIYETPTDLGTYGVILLGSFNQVDNKTRNGIVKLEVL